MPRKVGSRAGTKRSKTFSGCWTCRARGVKCDTVRPACNRCQKAKRVCEGYGIRLSWDQQTDSTAKPIKDRLLFSESDMIHPTFMEEEINSALELLDTEPVGEDTSVCQAGPFCVFKSVMNVDHERLGDENEEVFASDAALTLSAHNISQSLDVEFDYDFWHIFEKDYVTSKVDITINNIDFDDITISSPNSPRTCTSTRIGVWNEVQSASLTTKERLLPLLQPFLSSSSREERQLFHFYVTYLSPIMIATGHPDNPFQTVMIPLAMAAVEPGTTKTLNKALLHSIYALSSFHQSVLHNTKEKYVAGIRHQEISLRLLRSSLSEHIVCQRSAFLATIVLLSTIECITGQYSEWRIHVEAGSGWLRSLGSTWYMTSDETVMYQLFQVLEALGNTYRPRALKSQFHSEDENSDPETPTPQEETDDGIELDTTLLLPPSILKVVPSDDTYHAQRLYGITRPIFDMILEINRRAAVPQTQNELRALERKMLLINPSTQRFASPTIQIERLTRHNASAFHIALHIHYERTLLHHSSDSLQHLVEQGLYHLSSISELEADMNVCGMLWPVYVIACEANSKPLRDMSLAVFEKRSSQGFRGAANVTAMVLEVWHRRDYCSSGDELKNTSLGILDSLGIDLLLV